MLQKMMYTKPISWQYNHYRWGVRQPASGPHQYMLCAVAMYKLNNWFRKPFLQSISAQSDLARRYLFFGTRIKTKTIKMTRPGSFLHPPQRVNLIPPTFIQHPWLPVLIIPLIAHRGCWMLLLSVLLPRIYPRAPTWAGRPQLANPRKQSKHPGLAKVLQTTITPVLCTCWPNLANFGPQTEKKNRTGVLIHPKSTFRMHS